MRFYGLLILFIVNSINGQSKFDIKFENTDINRDYLKTEKSNYKIIEVHNTAELAALQNKDSIKAIRFELQYPEYDIKTEFTEILKFKNLEYLESSGDVVIPEEIDQLAKLKFFSQTVRSTTIPLTIGKLKNLETLRLKSCDNVKQLPESLYELVNLKELELDGLQHNDSISPKIGKLINLEKLSISSIVILPDEILNIKNLKYLYCYKPQPVIFKIKTLETLALYAYQSSDLAGIKNLSKLNELYLNIKEFNEELKELKNLKYLELTNNYNDDFMDLSSLANLEVLIIWSFNEIKEIPDFVYGLKNLKYLAVNTCGELKQVPEKINKMESLEYLELKYNVKLTNCPTFRKNLKTTIKEYGEL
jgi:Leucine-rich repeat (LRR) protein